MICNYVCLMEFNNRRRSEREERCRELRSLLGNAAAISLSRRYQHNPFAQLKRLFNQLIAINSTAFEDIDLHFTQGSDMTPGNPITFYTLLLLPTCWPYSAVGTLQHGFIWIFPLCGQFFYLGQLLCFDKNPVLLMASLEQMISPTTNYRWIVNSSTYPKRWFTRNS